MISVEKNEFYIGQKIGYSIKFKRVVDPALEGVRKYWEPFHEVGTGVVVGLRNLQNGTSENLGEDGRSWVFGSVQPVAMVSNSLWRKPFPVDIETAWPLSFWGW